MVRKRACDWCNAIRDVDDLVGIRSTPSARNDAKSKDYVSYAFDCRTCVGMLPENEFWISTVISVEQAEDEIACWNILGK